MATSAATKVNRTTHSSLAVLEPLLQVVQPLVATLHKVLLVPLAAILSHPFPGNSKVVISKTPVPAMDLPDTKVPQTL